jgi:uncharacterized Rossmann fold enzyme
MEFRDWEPVYERIIREFGYSREEDERAAHILAALAEDRALCDDICMARLFNDTATVVAGPSSSGAGIAELAIGTTLSVGIGTGLLLKEGRVPDLVVTDLDGDVALDLEANERGAVLVVHAHGDNISALIGIIPSVKGRLVLTTQSTPFGPVRNYGGFTDGDRAVALAVHFGVRRLRLIGFDLSHPRPKVGVTLETKAKKLRWAEKLINDIVAREGIELEHL